MKKPTPSYGFSAPDYQFPNILREEHSRYLEFEKIEKSLLKKEVQSNQEFNDLFIARNTVIKSGVTVIIIAVAHLEFTIYDYATHYIHHKSYADHFDRMDLVTKWLLVPLACKKYEISEDSPYINDLRELVKARNAIIHPKTKRITPKNLHSIFNNNNHLRFRHAANKAVHTVDGLIDLLKMSVKEKRETKPREKGSKRVKQ